MRFAPGDILDDKFRIVRLLGEGGMGIVYEGLNVRIGRRVAIKVLHADAASDDESARRFEQEGRACARIKSPHVVEVLDLGDLPGGLYYLVMEYLEGETLGARLDVRGTLTTIEAARIAEQVLRGLAALHDVGLVHRDIKPANLFLVSTPNGEVAKILDFGVAKTMVPPSARSPRTATGMFMGTARYMSPEQARGLNRLVDARADVYALGVVLYESLTGRPPFEGESFQDLLFRIALEEPPSIESLAPAVDPGFAAIVRHAMARAPEHRFASAREFHAALVAWAQSVTELRSAFGGTIPPMSESTLAAQRSSAPSDKPQTPTAWSERDAQLASTQLALDEVRASLPAAESPTRAEGSGKPAASARRSRRAGAWIAVALGIVAAGAVVASLARRPAHTEATDAAAVVPDFVAVTDIPVPPTTPEAAAEFAAALRTFRDGNTPAAMVRFAQALKADPKLGAAYVQRALMAATDDPVAARADYLRALDFRDTLGQRDAAIVKALGSCVLTEPIDFRACTAALAPLRAAYPRDTEIAFFIASIESMAGDTEVSTALFREALELDPKFGFAWARVGQDEAYAGHFDEARRSFASCIEIVPTSTFCRMNRLWVADQEGDPATCAADARALTVIAPDDIAYLEVFPQAIAALGRPRAAVEDALRPLLPKWGAVKSYKEGLSPAALDVLDGRFDKARPALEGLQEQFAASHDSWRWLHVTRTLLALLDEVGDHDAAARLASNLTQRLSVLPTNAGAEDWAIAQDPVPVLYEARFRAGTLARVERDAQREAWVAAWRARTTSIYLGYVWVHGYATYVTTPEEAAAALGALPSFGEIPRYAPKTAINADIGRTFLLAGDPARAIPYLRKAADGCAPLDYPFPFVRARLWLGEALARTGDTAGACEALHGVIARWGEARPRSTSGALARAKARDLGCP